MLPRIPRDAARRLGHYVYLYVDPTTGKPFYVGKGRGQRGLAHLRGRGDSHKARRIREIIARGQKPRIEVLAHGLPDEEAAFRIESSVIDVLGLEGLSNRVRGQRARTLGRQPLQDLVDQLAARPVTVRHPSILIRVNKLYTRVKSSEQLYDATRSAWKVGPRRKAAQYAMAVYEGVVKGVYKIDKWHPAGSTTFAHGWREQRPRSDRWEFTGRPAPRAIQRQYLGRSVARYLRRGSQNPICYVGCAR